MRSPKNECAFTLYLYTTEYGMRQHTQNIGDTRTGPVELPICLLYMRSPAMSYNKYITHLYISMLYQYFSDFLAVL
jgi:hypothetical protein